MKSLRIRLAAQTRSDEGMTLVEVMVAMFIFAIVSVGVIYTMLSVMTIGRDSRARQVASNLAAEAVDRVREEQDIFDVLDGSYTTELNGDTFTVNRTTAWVSDPGADFSCGGGGNQLRYKRVNIEVTWANMGAGTQPVRSDTIIDPKSRINDPTKGTILVSVLNGEGLGNPGVSVVAQPTTMAGAPTGSPLPAVTTDAQGCAYILRANPGNYLITISKAGHRDVANVASPTTTTSVAASATSSVSFTYDRLATLNLTYAAGADPVPRVATAMPTSLVSTYGVFTPTGSGTNPRQLTVFPFLGGYDALAGRYLPYRLLADGTVRGCLSPDPSEWTDGQRDPSIATPPATTVAGDVRLGMVQVAVGPVGDAGQRFVRAVAVQSPPSETGDPGCTEVYEFTFPSGTLDASGQAVLALPFGTWELYRGGSTPTNRITEAQITPLTNGAVNGSGGATTVTMDPRS